MAVSLSVLLFPFLSSFFSSLSFFSFFNGWGRQDLTDCVAFIGLNLSEFQKVGWLQTQSFFCLYLLRAGIKQLVQPSQAPGISFLVSLMTA